MFTLSKFIPVRMKTTYGTGKDPDEHRWRSSWWQWRGHIWGHKTVEL